MQYYYYHVVHDDDDDDYDYDHYYDALSLLDKKYAFLKSNCN